MKANPANLRSNLEYIDCFRNPDKMLSEPGYWYTNLYSAVSFVENATYESLTISKSDFEAGIAKSTANAFNEPLTSSVASIGVLPQISINTQPTAATVATDNSATFSSSTSSLISAGISCILANCAALHLLSPAIR